MCVFMHVWCGCRCCSVSAHDSLSEPPAHHLVHVSWLANPSNLQTPSLSVSTLWSWGFQVHPIVLFCKQWLRGLRVSYLPS